MTLTDQTPSLHDTSSAEQYRSIDWKKVDSVGFSYEKHNGLALFRHPKFTHYVELIEGFHKNLSSIWGESWMSTELSPGIRNRAFSDFISFAISYGLYGYSEHIIGKDSARINSSDPPLLYWAVNSLDVFEEDQTIGNSNFVLQSCHTFSRFLLAKGADPNASFEIDYVRFQPTVHSDQDPEKGTVRISLLQCAMQTSFEWLTIYGKTIVSMNLMSSLLRAGANARETRYRNYSQLRADEPEERSAIHYLVRRLDKSPYATDDKGLSPFDDAHEAAILTTTIECLLDHGADPNAVDSDGIDVLSSMLDTCPKSLIDYAMEKGAKIGISLLQENGMLDPKHLEKLSEKRWGQQESYTDEARERVRKFMPEWEELDEQVKEQVGEDDKLTKDVSEEAGAGMISKILGHRLGYLWPFSG
jgi:hypothetical protein